MQQQQLHYCAFFGVLRHALWGSELPAEAASQSAAIWKELQHHAVQHVAVDTIAALDPANQFSYIHSASKSYQHWYALMALQQQIMDCLDHAGIPCAVLKGAAADRYYPNPLNRNMGDIDLLVKPQDFAAAVAVLVDAGCELTDQRNPRHTEFLKNGIHIELHRHFATLDDKNRVETLDAMLFDALDRAEKVVLEGYCFSMLPTPENALVLMEHINSHMESGLGLRQILDWMLFVHNHISDTVWFDSLEGMMTQVGLTKLACTVTRMCQLYLGLSPEITWCQVADEDLCHRLMVHIMAQGNFGRKQAGTAQKTAIVLASLDTEKNFFRLLQKHGCHNWKALQRHPWLKPFAWAYQLCRYIRKAFRGKQPIRSVLRAFSKKKHNVDLMEALDIRRKNHALDYDN